MTPYDPGADVIEVIRAPGGGPVRGAYRTFGETLRRGAHGIAPDISNDPTVHLGSQAATRLLAGNEEATAATGLTPRSTSRAAAVRQLEPRRVPAPPPTGYPRPAREPDRAGGRAFRRFMAMLLVMLVFVAAVVIAVVIATNTSPTVVHFRTVAGRDAQQAIQSFQSLINQYTK